MSCYVDIVVFSSGSSRPSPSSSILRAIFRIFRTISTPLLALLNRAMLRWRTFCSFLDSARHASR